MRPTACFLVLSLALTGTAIAQPAGDSGASECKAQAAAIERDMAVARSKGQMLRRRQLADELAALQARCDSAPVDQGRAARIESLEQEVKDLRSKLDQAEEELRKLKGEAR